MTAQMVCLRGVLFPAWRSCHQGAHCGWRKACLVSAVPPSLCLQGPELAFSGVKPRCLFWDPESCKQLGEEGDTFKPG